MTTQTDLKTAAKITVQDVLSLKEGEQFLILTNPEENVLKISEALFDAALECGAEATLIIQPVKTQLGTANKAALAAFESNPEVCASISFNKMGKDAKHVSNPYIGKNGNKIDHVFHYQMNELKTLRSIWTPGITVDIFCRTAGIDYGLLQRRCKAISAALTGATNIHVTAAGGTDIFVPVTGRIPMNDDGDFTRGGTGGNIPAGEVFISPLPGQSEGTIVFDGSISLNDGDMITQTPVTVVFKNGYITDISGGHEAELLRQSIEAGEAKARELVAKGDMSREEGSLYEKNARGLGELGIGLNPSATISGNMLEDEKAFHTCHFAIGSNYDNDADSPIHLDCLVKNPTIEVHYPDGTSVIIEKDGILAPEYGDV